MKTHRRSPVPGWRGLPFAAVLAASMALGSESLAQPADLVASYPFSGNALDASGNGHDLTVIDAVLVPDRFGTPASAFGFNGSTSYLTADFDTSDDQTYSWTFWLLDTSTTGTFRRWLSTTSGQFTNNTVCIRENNVAGPLQAFAGSLGYLETGLEKGRWIFYALVADGVSTRVYADGVEVAATTAGSVDPEPGFFVGGFYGENPARPEYFLGSIDDIRLYDRALSAAEVESMASTTNALPVVTDLVSASEPVRTGTTVVAAASFSDLDLADEHVAVWGWGDGESSTGIVAEDDGQGTASGSHVYTTPGVHTVTLTVTDQHGGVGSAIFQYVVVYDPDGGFVTGGGWLSSPAGALPADPTLTGRASFGVVSRYARGATVPSGSTQFRFQAAGLDFRSDVYEWLVVAGARAQLKGTGAVGGSGDYGFLLTAIDGALPGGGGIDRFRIKIWDRASGDVLYDNMLGAGDQDVPTTTLGGGSIVIQAH